MAQLIGAENRRTQIDGAKAKDYARNFLINSPGSLDACFSYRASFGSNNNKTEALLMLSGHIHPDGMQFRSAPVLRSE